MANYLLPAEWHQQRAVLVTWPHAYSDWQPTLQDIYPCYQQIVTTIANYQKVVILCYNKLHQDHIKKVWLHSANLDNIIFAEVPTNDTWIRDYGPITVLKDGKATWFDMQFNAWGGKYDASLDNQATQQLHQLEIFADYDLIESNWVIEGGSIETNGSGVLLSTTSCLLDPLRNPDLSENELSHYAYECLGSEQLILLHSQQLQGDDTDGHIDTIVRFYNENHLCFSATQDKGHPHYEALQHLQHELDGLPELFNTTAITHPPAIMSKAGEVLPATYANFLITNEEVLVPTYGCETDNTALAQISELFPKHRTVGIDCRTLIEQNGSLHCATMQVPEIS